MKRGLRWPFLWAFLLAAGLWTLAHAIQGPVLSHNDNPANEREFQNVYQGFNTKPDIYTGAGAPTFAPKKIGDIYISTTTSKVYIATSAVTSTSWNVVN